MTFFKESDLKSKQLLTGIKLKAVAGEKTMITLFDLDPNAVIPSHKHPHEQISYIIKGEMEFTLEGKTQILREGDGVVIPSNKEHSARILSQPTKAIDAWYPIREEYRTI